ncbi:MAG: elongation factor G [Lentisphaerae bacterium]|nr:elongation factor G [Lentisphaerota bacterium]
MKDIAVSNVRNFAILGHSGSGKTTLTDAIAFKLGLNDRLGLVTNGSSVSDFSDEEKQRQISIFASSLEGNYTCGGAEYGLVFTDCPGFADFYGQVIAGIRASDTALITVDATAGVQIGVRRAWAACQSSGLKARGFVITGIDKDNANYKATLEAIKESFGVGCVPVAVPDGSGGVIDALAASSLPAEYEDVKTALVEAAAETNEELLEKYLGGEELSAEEIANGLREAVADGSMYPVFVTAALADKGITELLDGVCRLFPSPEQRTFVTNDETEVVGDANAPFSAFVWRTVVDPFMGTMNYVRVISGTLTTGLEVTNTSTGGKEKIGTIVTVVGRKQINLDKAIPGSIVALPKLKSTKTSHTLCGSGANYVFPPLALPSLVYYMAIQAKTQADEDKLGSAVSRLCEQDPTLLVEKNAETKQMVLKGLGDVHIDVAVSLMKSQSNVSVELTPPKVPYRETVTGVGEGHYRHKKQAGGRGQYGEVYLRVSPKLPDEEEWFIDEIVGGAIPGNFLPAIQKGLVEAMQTGSLARSPVENVKVAVYDGSYHDVDSSEIAFKIAGSRAFRDAMSKAKPVLLEPIMTLAITIPEAFMGSVNGDLIQKRGRVLGLDAADGMQVINAEAPLAEILKYAAELRSMTGGQGSFQMEYTRYDVVPANVAQKVIAEAAKGATDDDDE